MTATSVLIIGPTGSGKSTSIQHLNPEETYIINVDGKSLPFNGWKDKYQQKDGGNYCPIDNIYTIKNILKDVSDNRKNVKQVILDDVQFVVGNSFMARLKEGGFSKFNEIGTQYFELVQLIKILRDDLIVVFLSHSEITDHGIIKAKTYGKACDENMLLESKFTYVFQTCYIDNKFKFQTKRTDEKGYVKSPMGIFEEIYIDNDLKYICDEIRKYEWGSNDI